MIKTKQCLPQLYSEYTLETSSYNRLVTCLCSCLFVRVMVFNATFHNNSVISWQSSVLLVEETGWPGEYHRRVASHWQTYHIMLYTSPWSRFELTSVVISTHCIGSCKSSYHTITVTTAPVYVLDEKKKNITKNMFGLLRVKQLINRTRILRLFNRLTWNTVVYMICNMNRCNITSRSLIIVRLSESNTTTVQIYSVQYLVYLRVLFHSF